MILAAYAGRAASIADLLADVRRIKMAGDGLRASCSRPETAGSSPRAAPSTLHSRPGQRNLPANSPAHANTDMQGSMLNRLEVKAAVCPNGRTADAPGVNLASDKCSPVCTDAESECSLGSCDGSRSQSGTFTPDSVDAALQARRTNR